MNMSRIHPLMAGAAVSVILVSLLGAAAITGLLPSSNSTPDANKNATQLTNTSSTDSTNPTMTPTMAPTMTPTMAPDNLAAANPATKPGSANHGKQSTHRSSNSNSNNNNSTLATAATQCEQCGTVASVRLVSQKAAHGSGVGAVTGAVLGGLLGNQVGNGNGRKVATVAGAIGGGLAGNEIEKRNNTTQHYEVRVKMSNGTIRTFTPSADPGLHSGDSVQVVDGHLTLRG